MNHEAVTYVVCWEEVRERRTDEAHSLKEAQDTASRISTAGNAQNVRIEKITRTITTEEVDHAETQNS